MGKRFYPKEVLFSPSSRCNLRCGHCYVKHSRAALPPEAAVVFLKRCFDYGVKRVGFTGGEPFLSLRFMLKVIKRAIDLGMIFGRITTNGAWFKDVHALRLALQRLKNAGYDGDIAVSVDFFHSSDLSKVAQFIRTAVSVFERADIVSIVSVYDKDKRSVEKYLRKLASMFGARFYERRIIRSKDIFVRVDFISRCCDYHGDSLSGWSDKTWFDDDFCRGPGNIFFVSPSGSVSPCCGYANEEPKLSIGTIRDLPAALVSNARRNIYVKSAFECGLGDIRKKLQKHGIKFPGKTSEICYFCGYILTRRLLDWPAG